MTIRILSAGLLTLLLVLPGMAGVHHHVSLAVTHDQLEDIQPTSSLDADHQAEHEHHGQVDVDPPAKAFAKSFSGKLPLAALLACSSLILLLPARTQLVVAQPPLRPPRYRSRPHLFPPSQAPPVAG